MQELFDSHPRKTEILSKWDFAEYNGSQKRSITEILLKALNETEEHKKAYYQAYLLYTPFKEEEITEALQDIIQLMKKISEEQRPLLKRYYHHLEYLMLASPFPLYEVQANEENVIDTNLKLILTN